MLVLKLIYHITSAIEKIWYKLIFGNNFKYGKGFNFRKGFSMAIEEGGVIEIGKCCFFNNYCSLNALSKISIGDNCIFGENVRIYDHNHRFSDKTKGIMEEGYSKEPVIIGKDCWIGSNVTILKGVKIGDNVIIGAGVVVNEDIPSNMVIRANNELLMEERR